MASDDPEGAHNTFTILFILVHFLSNLCTPQEMNKYTSSLRNAVHNTFRNGQGTRDLCGPAGLTTEAFVAKVEWFDSKGSSPL